MKSFVEYPLEFEKMSFIERNNKSYLGKSLPEYELYKKISHLDGCVVKCGVATEEGIIRFTILKSLIAGASQSNQKVIAFQKIERSLVLTNNRQDNVELQYKVEGSVINTDEIQQKLKKEGITEEIEFIPGAIGDSIPEYLMENPDTKIRYLNIDFDDYEAALTTLQYLYPRLVHGGILSFDNYYKKEEDYRAARDFFKSSNIKIHSMTTNKRLHYWVRL
ncbi:MAG TPA: TylF/MycF/NovP-related O-methyltransferase [Segetibacter sp.]|nr:TylF/MycF/NovP-related O-methyltransferase [Segetibacter sp.]